MLVTSTDSPKHLVRQAVGIPRSGDKKLCPTGREKPTFEKDDQLTNVRDQKSNKFDSSRNSLNDDRVAPNPVLKELHSWSEVERMMEGTMKELTNR